MKIVKFKKSILWNKKIQMNSKLQRHKHTYIHFIHVHLIINKTFKSNTVKNDTHDVIYFTRTNYIRIYKALESQKL